MKSKQRRTNVSDVALTLIQGFKVVMICRHALVELVRTFEGTNMAKRWFRHLSNLSSLFLRTFASRTHTILKQ